MTAEEADILANATKEKGHQKHGVLLLPVQGRGPLCQGPDRPGQDWQSLSCGYAVFPGVGPAPCGLPAGLAFYQEPHRPGALGDLGCHALDLVRFVLGKEYTNIVGHTGTYVKERKLEKGEGRRPGGCGRFLQLYG